MSGAYQTDDYKTPKNNTVLIWNGTTWRQENAKNFNNHIRYNFSCVGAGAGSGSTYDLNGFKNFVPPLGVGTHTYKLTATGPGGSKMCQATVVVPPTPEPSCTLTANPSDVYEGDSVQLQWTSSNVSAGSINQGVGAISPVANGSVTVSPNTSKTYTATFTGSYGDVSCSTPVTVNPPPVDSVIIKATKIVCDYETDLPNWSGSATNITATTATDFLATHSSCRLEPNWSFEYATGNTPNPGDNTIGVTGGAWNVFSDTNSDGVSVATVVMNAITQSTLWVREVNKTGYIPFTGISGSNVSPEMYCNTDVVNYDNYDFINNPVKDTTYYCVAFNVKKATTPNDPFCTLSADPTSITSGNASALTWTTTNATSFVLDKGIGTSTPTAGGSVSTGPLTTTTTFTGTARNAQGDTATCSATVGVLPSTGLSCTLSLDKSQITSGESATLSWTSSNAVSGFINKNVGTTTPVSSGSVVVFPPDGTTYTGTFKAANGDAVTCSTAITVVTGGCSGSCGGGLEQPRTVLFKKPGDQPLAFVSLSQIPYTGFEAGPLLSLLFWFAVVLWSFGIAYVLVGKESVRYAMRRMFGVAPLLAFNRNTVSEQRNTYEHDEPTHDVEMEYFNTHTPVQTQDFVHAHTTPTRPRSLAPYVIHQSTQTEPLVKREAVDGIPSLGDVLESRAHAAGVLLSPEAAHEAMQLGATRDETLQLFGRMLDSAVRTLPREDGWILLSSDRFNNLRSHMTTSEKTTVTETSSAPERQNGKVTEAVSENIVNRLAGDIVSGARDDAFALLKQLENEGANARTVINGVAFALDDVYRARKTNTPAKDMVLAQKAQFISEDKLAELVEVFTRAFDVSYNSAFTAFKISLAQAFDVRA